MSVTSTPASGPDVRPVDDHPRPAGGYIPSLDGLRAVSIVIVFFAHAGLSPLIPGGFGVTVFFFLSGFLITTLLVKEQEAYGSIAMRAFYLRRVVRLGPPLVITLVAAAIAVWLGLAKGDLDPWVIISQLFFFYNYYDLYGPPGGSVDGLGVLWSLSVEEHFYLIYPSVFLAFARGWIGLRTIVAILVAILAWRCVRTFGLGHSEWRIYISTDGRFDSMLYGCLLALMTWRGLTEAWLKDRWMYPLLAAGIALLLVSFLVRDPAFRSTLRYSLQGLALMPIFHFAVTRPEMPLFRPLNWAPVRRIGQYSYTLYLVHFVVINAMVFNGLDKADKALFIPLAALISVVYAALVFELAEKPLKPLRARLTGH